MQFPCMLLQVEVPAKALGADVASERFAIVMRVHVKCEVVYLVEGFIAHGTFVSFLAAVG